MKDRRSTALFSTYTPSIQVALTERLSASADLRVQTTLHRRTPQHLSQSHPWAYRCLQIWISKAHRWLAFEDLLTFPEIATRSRLKEC